MLVAELIKKLQALDPKLEVHIHYDGADRIDEVGVYVSRSGYAVLAESPSDIYYDEDRPVGAPLSKAFPAWSIDMA